MLLQLSSRTKAIDSSARRIPVLELGAGDRVLAPGFTLIELLVVVAVIALVTSLAVTGLQRAKRLTRGVHCFNNMRQIFLAYELYKKDNGGRGRPHTNGGSSWLPEIEVTRENLFYGYWGRGYAEYLNYARKVFACPAADPENFKVSVMGLPDDRSNGGRFVDTSYGFNGFQFWDGPGEVALFELSLHPFEGVFTFIDSPARRITDSRMAPSETIVFQDSKETMLDGSNDTPVNEPAFSEYHPPHVVEMFRHGGRCHVMWLDGHVESIKQGLAHWKVDWYALLY